MKIRKTDKLFEQYFKLFNEQEPGGANIGGIPDIGGDPMGAGTGTPGPEEMPPAGEEEPAPVEEMDENEKYIIKILTNSFIFNKDRFDDRTQSIIEQKIERIKNLVNVPVAETIKQIKQVLAFDRSLRVESATLKLINRYLSFIEQTKDATEPQGEQPKELQSTETGILPPNENQLNLAEIFPGYKELIVKALEYPPSDDEIISVRTVVDEFSETDPSKIVDAIRNVLSTSPTQTDKNIETNLANA